MVGKTIGARAWLGKELESRRCFKRYRQVVSCVSVPHIPTFIFSLSRIRLLMWEQTGLCLWDV
jgi:hypothetical protein